jgi:hypothetical protein
MALVLIVPLLVTTACSQVKPPSPPAPPTQPQLWGIACPALLDEANGSNHDQLPTREMTPANISKQKELLDKWWGVRSRDDLLHTLKWIEYGGHRRSFNDVCKAVEANDPKQLAKVQASLRKNDAQFAVMCKICSTNHKQLGSKSLMGWDYCRYIDLCRWGFEAGYITEAEAWGYIMPAAKLLQTTFDSWQDLGHNYIIGRQFWKISLAKDEQMAESFQTLTTELDSPWNKLPWTLSLP